jgi:peptidyl-prolyl cis-trans isomerase B (cyclophilin B)
MKTAIIETNLGNIEIELDHVNTPITCNNFITYAEQGHYDDTIFHRVIDGFMIQGGGLTADLSQKETNEPIENEADKGLTNKTGTIAMARTSDPHSATSQFFINVQDNDFLNYKSKTTSGWGYCVFGNVINGMDVVNKIKAVKTTTQSYYQDVPAETIVIKTIKITA